MSTKELTPFHFGIFFLVAMIAGTIGYAQALPGDSFLDWVYYSLQLFALQPASKEFEVNGMLQWARFLAPCVLAYSTIGIFIYSSGRKARELWGYGLKDHVIVVGDTDLAFKQAVLFRSQPEARSVVLISDQLSEEQTADLAQKGILVLSLAEEATGLLNKVKIQSASTVVLMMENEERAQDWKRSVLASLENSTRPVLVLIQGEASLEDDVRAAGFKGQSVESVLEKSASGSPVDVVHFNPYQLAAQKMLVDFGPHLLVKQSWMKKNEQPHVVLFGLGSLASSWMKVAMANCHFHAGQKMRMTVFYDRKTEEEKAEFYRARFSKMTVQNSRLHKVQTCHKAEYSHVGEGEFLAAATEHATRYFDLHFEGIHLDQVNLDQLEDVFKSRVHANEKAVVYVCHEDDTATLHMARVLGASYESFDAMIAKCVVCIQEEKRASRHLRALQGNSDFMVVFPIEEALKGEAHTRHIGFVEACSRNLHHGFLKEFALKENYGTRSYFMWDHLPEEKKNSNRNAVLHFHVKASLFGMEDLSRCDYDFLREQFQKNEKELSHLEHQRWEAHHFVEGWRLGPRLDSAYQHPCLVPYEWLSQHQKDKDSAQNRTVLEACEKHTSGRNFA